MSDTERLSIDRILDLWLASCGEVKTSPASSTYLVVPFADRRGHLLNLIQALVQYGYSEQEIRTGNTSMKVVKMCWSDLIKNMSTKKVRESREIARKQWSGALDEFFVTDFPKYVKPEKIAPLVPKTESGPLKKEITKEELLTEILNPKDRLVSSQKIDRSNDTNWELLEELGIESDEALNE